MKNVPNKIIVHHSAFAQSSEQLGQINQWHKDREFIKSSLGYYVGYHYLISHAGIITATRKIEDEGCHTKGQNTTSIGVCMEGHFDQEMPTAKQTQMLGKLLVSLCEAHSIPYTSIEAHRSFSNTSCFGKKLHNNFAKITCLTEKIHQLSTAVEALREESRA